MFVRGFTEPIALALVASREVQVNASQSEELLEPRTRDARIPIHL